MEVSKKDWKLYREKIGNWQEAYIEKLVAQYVDYLNSDLSASETGGYNRCGFGRVFG